MKTMGHELTDEQQYMLHKVRLEAQSMSRSELVEALCSSWAARYQQRQIFTSVAQQAGIGFSLKEEYPWQRPETEDEFKELLGYVPTEQEAGEYLNRLWENARMEIDMDEIVLTPDDESVI